MNRENKSMDDCQKCQDRAERLNTYEEGNLQDEIDRLRDLYSMALSRLQSISEGTLSDDEWLHIHVLIKANEGAEDPMKEGYQAYQEMK
jgi:hypothetical protein